MTDDAETVVSHRRIKTGLFLSDSQKTSSHFLPFKKPPPQCVGREGGGIQDLAPKLIDGQGLSKVPGAVQRPKLGWMESLTRMNDIMGPRPALQGIEESPRLIGLSSENVEIFARTVSLIRTELKPGVRPR